MPYVKRQDDISTLPLSKRAQNCLRRAHLNTIGEIIDYPEDEFIRIRNMGALTVNEIQGFIQSLKNKTGEYILVENDEQITDDSYITQESIDNDGIFTIVIDKTGAIVKDLSVQELELSVRAKNCLVRGGYLFVSQLIGITFDTLMSINNMGIATANEVLAYVEKIFANYNICEVSNIADYSVNNLAREMFAAYGLEESIWIREILTTKAQFPEATSETLIYRLYDSDFVRNKMKDVLLQIIEENNNEISKISLEERLPQHLKNTTIIEEVLLELESISALEMSELMIYRQYPSITEYVSKIEDERVREVIQRRLEGKTLHAIGKQYGITKERARQLMLKGLRNKPYMREDQYTYIFDNYGFSLEDFMMAFDEPPETYYYLEMISKTVQTDRKFLEEILTDTKIAPEYRKKAERPIYKQYISTDGVRVMKTRLTLVKHFIKTYCRNLTEFDVFFQKYHEWLETLELGDTTAFAIESRSYENKINQCNYVLWNQWRSFRYYNIPEHDYEELLSTLNLDEYENTEISSLKLFRDYPELMEQYDIRDEYELHNLLKKTWIDTDSQVNFGKMPTIEIGVVDRNNQVLSLLLQYAPISGEAFAERYEETYGIKASTVRANYMSAFDPYYFEGVYSVDFAALPTIQSNRMKEILVHDFYTIQDVKRLYKREFPNSDESLINPYTLKTLDFRVYSGYVVKSTYSTAADYFRYLLTTDDIVDARNISKSIQSVVAYSSELYKLRADHEIVEFSPLQYINIRRLNAAGITSDHFNIYCKDVFQKYEKGEYFTVTSLYREGFTHEMDDLGFDEWFYASILLEDRERFSYQRIGGTRIFLCGKTSANFGDMLVWLLEKHQKIDLYDLIDLLDNHYGIKLPKDKLLTIIDGTELYYDTIMEAIYIDYDTYFEEI